MDRKKKIILALYSLSFFVPVIFLITFVIWTLLIGAYILSIICLSLTFLLLPFAVKGKYYFRFRLIIILLLGFLTLITLKHNIGQIDYSFSKMAGKINSKTSCDSFSFKEKLSIFMLNIYMGSFGYFIYPEAAKETLLMVFKDNDGKREYESNFPMKSEFVKKRLEKIFASLPKSKNTKEHFSFEIFWSGREYTLGSEEARYALALNSMWIEADAYKKNSKWVIDCLTATRISYAKNYNAVLIDTGHEKVKNKYYFVEPMFGNMKLSVNEGLFKILEDCGWLFPYDVKYKFSLNYTI